MTREWTVGEIIGGEKEIISPVLEDPGCREEGVAVWKKGGEETEAWIEIDWIGRLRAIGELVGGVNMGPASRTETERDSPIRREVLVEALMGGDIPRRVAIGNGAQVNVYVL